jgi:hypothetical protein
LKKSRLYLGFEKGGIVFGIIAAIILTHPVSAQFLMSRGTYAQNFNSLADSATIGLSHRLPDFPGLATRPQPFRTVLH